MKAISIKQPWAYLILNRDKRLENRSWSTKERGRVLIHAGLEIDEDAMKHFELQDTYLPTGCVVGSVEIEEVYPANHPDVVNDPWNMHDKYVWKLANPVKFTPFKMKGKLRFWEVNMSEILK